MGESARSDHTLLWPCRDISLPDFSIQSKYFIFFRFGFNCGEKAEETLEKAQDAAAWCLSKISRIPLGFSRLNPAGGFRGFFRLDNDSCIYLC